MKTISSNPIDPAEIAGEADSTAPNRSAAVPSPTTRAQRGATLDNSRLAQSPFLSRDERRALDGAVLGSRHVAANSDVFLEKEHVDTLFLISTGWASRYTMTSDGGRQIATLLLPGDIGNLDSLLLPTMDYGLGALTDATIVTLSRDRLTTLAAEHPGIARTLTWLALVENATLGRVAHRLGRLSANQRLAHLLCELCVRLGDDRDEGACDFAFSITQEQLADVLGLTAVHINRMLQQLRGEGLIERVPAMMRICDIKGLRRAGGFTPTYLYLDQQDEHRATTGHHTPSVMIG